MAQGGEERRRRGRGAASAAAAGGRDLPQLHSIGRHDTSHLIVHATDCGRLKLRHGQRQHHRVSRHDSQAAHVWQPNQPLRARGQSNVVLALLLLAAGATTSAASAASKEVDVDGQACQAGAALRAGHQLQHVAGGAAAHIDLQRALALQGRAGQTLRTPGETWQGDTATWPGHPSCTY